MELRAISPKIANEIVVARHYLHRKTNIRHAYGLFIEGVILGVVTFGTPPSRHLQKGASPSNPNLVIELNRLWVCDTMPKNTESWFVSRALKRLPPFIVVSYADTAEGHSGFVYRALNFYYAGWTDMDRKTPRFDYVVPGKHSRDAFRGDKSLITKVRRKPKHKYWTVTGDRREKREMEEACTLQKLNWKEVRLGG